MVVPVDGADPASSVALADLNRMDRESFVGFLGAVFEETPSVAEAAFLGVPFDSVDAVHETMCAVVRGSSAEAQLDLLRRHPELGARRPMAAMSASEQRSAGLDQVAQVISEQLESLNLDYRERFGFPFIIAVRGRTPVEILAALRERLQNPVEEEREVALDQVMVIAGLRLAGLICEPQPVEPVVATHAPDRSGHRGPNGETSDTAPTELSDHVDNSTAGLEHAWHPVARSTELADDPLRVTLLGRDWVLFRSTGEVAGGEVTAMADRCVHRGAPLSAGCVVDGTIECPYHGWRYGSDGACVDIPALAGGRAPARARVAVPWGLVERYGLIWMAPEEPVMDLIEVPECEDPSFGVVLSEPVRTSASAAQVVDNFLDVTHFSYLHSSTFGLTAPVTVEDYVVERGPWQVSLHHRTMFSAGDEPARPRVGHYHCTIPFLVRLVGEFPGTERRDVICLFAQPESADSTRIYKMLAYNELGDGSPADRTLGSMDEFETAVLAEDIRMLEMLPETRVPLSPTAEFHTKADRATVEWRRLLRTLLQAGTSDAVASPGTEATR